MRTESEVVQSLKKYTERSVPRYTSYPTAPHFSKAIGPDAYCDWLKDLPAGSGASRLLGGEHPIFRQLEQAFAAFKGAPDALYFGSGYAANEALGGTMASMGGRIFSDSLNHASIIDGIRLSELSRDQRREVRRVLEDILAPYRQEDAKEAMELIRANGMKNLHMAFYKNQDVGDDGVWDVWQIEGPSMICYFRGDPHVHAYLNVKKAPDELDKKFAEA